MGVGPNYGLDKGFLVEGSSAIAAYTAAIPGTGAQAAVTPSATSTTTAPLGVWQEDVDATRVATGKVVANVRLTGITRMVAGVVSITKGSRLTFDNQGRATMITRAAAGAQPAAVLGIALSAAAAVGDHFDVLLTPGATY